MTTRAVVQRYKIERAVTRIVDAKAGRIHAIVSTEDKDRQGDIIRQSGWDLVAFQKHPVLLSSHDYMSLRSQIGEWEEMGVQGKKLQGIARYYIGEGNAEADWAFNLAMKGRAAYSVGFQPDMSLAKRLESEDGSDAFFGSWEFNGQELLEVSHVTVPANAHALQTMKGLHGLHPVIAGVVEELLGETKAEETTTVQTLILAKDTFETEAAASKWVRDHDFKVPDGGADETEDSWRYRQREPGDFDSDSFRTIDITTGVKAVVGHLKALMLLGFGKDAHGDMAEMKTRMEKMSSEMGDMASMMGDMMDGMKAGKGVTREAEEAIREAAAIASRAAVLGSQTRENVQEGLREVFRP